MSDRSSCQSMNQADGKPIDMFLKRLKTKANNTNDNNNSNKIDDDNTTTSMY